MSIRNLTEPSIDEETKIEGIADNLYERIQEETEALLRSQLQLLGVEIPDDSNLKGVEGLTKTTFQDDQKALAIYEYKGREILGIRVSDNNMAIEFDVPELETQKEVQDV